MANERSRLEFVGELAGGLAHEIKNPLSTMRLHLEMMEEDFRSHKNEEERRNHSKVSLLLKEIHRLEEIVQEFLKVSRGHDLKLTALDLKSSLENVIELVRPQAEQNNVSLHLQIIGKPCIALLDENYFHRAILNLVQNAILACEPKKGGDVMIEVGRSGGAIGIAIIDTGVGIPEGVKERIFRAYFSTRSKGTGMGLPMAKRIIEEHGGYIAFDSVEGQGSRFMIMLPAYSDESLSQLALRNQDRNAPPLKLQEPIDVSLAVDAVLAESKETQKITEEDA